MDKIFRASKLGFPCQRSVWYSVNANEQGLTGTVSSKSQRIFDVGTALEPVIVSWLEADGWNVEYNPGSQDAELEVTIPIYGGKLAGHPDCIISKGEIQNALVDIKTMNERAFTQWKREGTLKAKPQYVTQVHIYAAGLKAQGRKIEHLGIVGVNKNNSEMHIDFFDYDESTYLDIVSRAEMIANAQDPAELDGATEKWACGYCEYYGICKHPKDAEEIVSLNAGIETTEDETIINAMKTLQNARELSKQARELEAYAKPVLEENVKDKGIRSLQGGGLLFTLKERMSTHFDTTGFKKAHPEIAGQFTKPILSVIYDIKPLKEEANADM